MKEQVRHVDILDHARGIAVLSVFVFHCFGTTFGGDNLPWDGWVRSFALHKYLVTPSFMTLLPAIWGWAGVSIFFVVSGFCIHMSFQQQGQQWGNFFIRRFFRIYPPYLASILFCELLKNKAMLYGTNGSAQWLTHLLLIHNYGSNTFMGINPVFWSIAIEVQLYLIYPLLIAFAIRLGWRRAVVITAIFELSTRSFQGLAAVTGCGATSLGHFFGILSSSPLGYWFSWSIGAFIADAVLHGKPMPMAKVSPVMWLILAIETSLIKPLAPLSFILFSLATAAAISRTLNGNVSKISLPKAFLTALRQTGIWSYSIYLLHFPLLRIFMCCVTAIRDDIYNYPIAFFLICLLTGVPIVLFSAFWYKLFELPGIAWGKSLIRTRLAIQTYTGRQPA